MKIIDFVKEIKEQAVKELLQISGSAAPFHKRYEFARGHADITIIRGGALEKAVITQLELSGIRPPGTDKEVNGIVYQMEIFPDNPHVPMGHFNTEWTMNGKTKYHMNLDLFPAVTIDEDLNTVKALMDGVADRFGRDRIKMREGLDEHYNMDHWKTPLATKVGCKLLNLGEDEVDLFIAAYKTFFSAYVEILKKRKDTPCNEADLRLKLDRNGKWLEYITLKDQAIKMAQASGIPSAVLIDLSYPPSSTIKDY
jgi:coproporphyrinogen III oxidase